MIKSDYGTSKGGIVLFSFRLLPVQRDLPEINPERRKLVVGILVLG